MNNSIGRGSRLTPEILLRTAGILLVSTTRDSARVGAFAADPSVQSVAELANAKAEIQRLSEQVEKQTNEMARLRAELAKAKANSEHLRAGAPADR